jgi:AraC-like DNA-binding protein
VFDFSGQSFDSWGQEEFGVPKRFGRSAGLTGYIELARAIGVDPYRMASSINLPAACLTNPDLKIPADAIGSLLEATARRSGVADIGLRLAESRKLSNLGIVGLVVREQPTLRIAVEVLVNYIWLQNEAISCRLESDSDIAFLRIALLSDRRTSRQASELVVGVLIRTLRSLHGSSWRPEAVTFEHGALASLATYRRVLGVTPEFNAESTGVAMLTSELDAPIAAADADMARHVQHYVDQLGGKRKGDPASVVRELLTALLPNGDCSIERVAAHMGINRRTLHRQLASQGATFTELLNDVRRRVTEAHLSAADRSLTEIAELIGYSSLSAFSRWRRSWHAE